jgi:hypothetical protein
MLNADLSGSKSSGPWKFVLLKYLLKFTRWETLWGTKAILKKLYVQIGNKSIIMHFYVNYNLHQNARAKSISLYCLVVHLHKKMPAEN